MTIDNISDAVLVGFDPWSNYSPDRLIDACDGSPAWEQRVTFLLDACTQACLRSPWHDRDRVLQDVLARAIAVEPELNTDALKPIRAYFFLMML